MQIAHYFLANQPNNLMNSNWNSYDYNSDKHKQFAPKVACTHCSLIKFHKIIVCQSITIIARKQMFIEGVICGIQHFFSIKSNIIQTYVKGG